MHRHTKPTPTRYRKEQHIEVSKQARKHQAGTQASRQASKQAGQAAGKHGGPTLVMPMPESVMVRVLLVLSGTMWMYSSGLLSSWLLSVRLWYLLTC